MIDLHLHLLPAIDDGASSLSVSREMIAIASSLGFERLVATPHLDGPLDPAYERQAKFKRLELAEIGHAAGVAIDLGYEIQLDPGLARRLTAGSQATLAGSRAVLVELPFNGWPMHAEQSLFELQTAGYRPLLAHPERYVAVQANLDKAVALAERGVLLQVTFSTLTGLFGRAAQRVAEELLDRNLATVLATDAHGAGQRLLSVGKGLDRARELVGEARLNQLTRANPAALLADEPLPAPAEPMRSKTAASGLFKGLASKLRGV